MKRRYQRTHRLAVEVATLEQLLDAHQLAHAHPSGSSADIIAGHILPFAPEPDRLPLLAPAGAIVAMTDNGDDYSRLHDEPSRGLRVFPGAAEGASRAILFEDDGISLVGASARGDRAKLDREPGTRRGRGERELSAALSGDARDPA